MTRSSLVSASWLTPKTMVLSAPLAGAETMTRFEPFSRCSAAFARSVKMPVHSSATSTSPHGSAFGSRSAVTLIGPRPTSIVSPVDGDGAGEAAVHRVVAHQVGVGLDRPEVVERDHLDVVAARLDDRAQHVAPDAAEAVDCNLDRHVSPYVPCSASASGAPRRASPRSRSSRRSASIAGSNRRSSAQVRANSAGPGYRPARIPASQAAPSAVVSSTFGPVDRRAEGVGEALQHPVVRGHAAVDAEHGVAGLRPVGAHRLDEVAGLVGDALERGAGELGRAGAAGEAEDRAAAVGVPVGRARGR